MLSASGIELERDASFGVAGELFTPVLAPASAGERARLLSGHASLAAGLFDPAAPLPEDPSALIRGLYWLTVNAVAAGAGAPGAEPGSPGGEGTPGLLIAVDDAQWADRPSLSYLAYLAARIDELSAALVVAVRSGEQPADQQTVDWLRDRAGARLLKPRELTPEGAARLLRAELPAAVRADGIMPTAGSVSRVRSLVPGSVLRSVLVRLARLGEPAEQLAKAVAVLGDRTPVRRARLLSGLEAERAERAADALADAHILAPGEPLRFSHPLIATGVYADIPAFARGRAHRRAADLLIAEGAPSDVVAAHLLLTQPDGDQQTVATLREAAGRALARGDSAAAAHMLARAQTEPPALPERGQVLLELANAEIEHGAISAGAHIDQALALLKEPAARVRALAARGRLCFNQGEHEAAVPAMEEAMELLEPGDPWLPSLLVSYLTAATFRAGLHPLAAQRIGPVIEAARVGQLPDDPGLLAHLVLRLAFAGDPAARIRELAERATSADPLVDPASLGILNGLVVQALCCVDELDAAERISDAALAAARLRGSLLSFSMASYHPAIGRYYRGELASALADLDQSRAATTLLTPPHQGPWTSRWLSSPAPGLRLPKASRTRP